MKSCVSLVIGLSAALMAPLTCGQQQQRTLLRGRLPGIGEVNVTLAEKHSSDETPLVHVVTHKDEKEADSNTPKWGFLTGNLATRYRVASLRARIDFDEREQIHHPDMDLTAAEMIERRNYPVETHFANTEDGFVLEMHRIPQPNGFPVLLQHGFLGSSTAWILNGPETSLAYILWDLGYDVWLGNLRGNNYAQRHLTLSKDDPEFWNHSFHEMGVYDLPGEIDYILRWTGRPQLNYIGHSMGTTVFFVMASERPEYNSKIRQMHALAPVCYLSRMRSPLKLLTLFMDGYNSKDFMPRSDFWKHFARQYCKDGASTQRLCAETLFNLCGRNPSQLNMTTLPLIFSHYPAGVSLKTAMHFGQEIKSGKFRQFDYGTQENMMKYGQPQPPDYDLSKVTCPVYIYYAENDWLVHKSNSLRLINEIPGCKFMYRVPHRKFNHMDFTWAIDVKPLLFDVLLTKLLEE